MIKKFLVFCFISLICSLGLFAEITASYNQEPKIVWTTNSHGFSEFSNKLNAKLGNLTLNIPKSANAFKPMLVGLGSYTYCYLESYDAWGNYSRSTAQVFVAVYVDNQLDSFRLLYVTGDNPIPLYDKNGNLKDSTIRIDFYLCTNNEASWYAPDTTITINTDLGLAQVAVANNSNDNIWDPDQREIVPIINGGYHEDDFEIITGGATNDKIESEFGDPDKEKGPELFLEILPTQMGFPIEAIVETNSRKIADLLARVTGSESEYTIIVTFSDTNSSSNDFILRHEQMGYQIPYQLKLGNTPVIKNVPMIGWNNLPILQAKTIELFATGVPANIARLAGAGSYSDTITIDILVAD